MEVYIDNKSVIEFFNFIKFVDDRRFWIDIVVISEIVNNEKNISVKWCVGKN